MMKSALFFLALFVQVIFISAAAKPECESDDDCMSNAACLENTCQCIQGYVEVKKMFRRVCLPYASQDNEFTCEADEQCSLIQDESNPEGKPAACSILKRVCSCMESTWFPSQDEENTANPICVRGFDSSCDRDEQCQRSIPNAMCLENKCACGEDFVKMEDELVCLPYATPENNECMVDEQCGRMHDSKGYIFNKHPKCDNDTSSCVCHKDNWILKDDTCVRGVGARCGLLLPCGVENSECKLLAHKCQCKEGFVPNEETHTCEEASVHHGAILPRH